MAGPWEKFSSPVAAPSAPKPWEQYAAPTPSPASPTETETATAEPLSQDDLVRIGKKHGVDPEELRKLAPYYQADTMPKEEDGILDALATGARRTAGFAASSVGMNIPQFIYKKRQDPGMRAAIDELQDIASKQKSGLSLITEFAAPGIGIPRALVKSAAGRLATGTGLGAVAGAAGSREGEELKSAGMGAAIGGGLSSTSEILTKLFAKRGASGVERELARREVDIGRGVEDVAKRTSESEKMLAEVGFGNRTQFNDDELDVLLKQQMSADSLANAMDPSSETGTLLRSKLAKERPDEIRDLGMERTIRRELADGIVETRVRDFAEDLSGSRPRTMDEALEVINSVSGREGGEATLNRYKQFLRLKQAEKYLDESAQRAYKQPNFFGRALNFISDNQFVLRDMDDKYGTSAERILSDLNRDYNRSTFALKNFRKAQDDIFQAARKNGTDDEIATTDKLYYALDSGKTEGLTEQERQSLGNFKKYFDSMLGFVNRTVQEGDPRIAPLSIPKRENYVPHMMVETPEVIARLETRLEKSLPALEAQRRGKLEVVTPEIQELVDAVRMFDNREVNTAAELISRVKDLTLSREGRVALETAARAAQERTGEIPDFLREKNLYKLADKYTANTLRHLYLRNGIDKLRYEAAAMRKAGADVDAQYVENLIRDIMGVRKGTAAEAFLQTKVAGMRQLDKLIDKYGRDSIQGGVLNAAKAIPEVMYAASRQIYPNLLGYFSPRAALQNLTSAFTKIAPELGTNYGYTATLRGGVYTLANLRRLMQKSKELGTIPADFTRQGERAIADGIRRSSLYQIPAAALEGMGRAGMVLFQKLEDYNRALVLGIGEMMARDLSKGSATAMGALRKFPMELRKQVLANRDNPEMVANMLGKYLNDVTQYNYNRMSLSEFGRTLGPIFSTFSKWPTATAGDLVYELRSKGALRGTARGLEKYLAPLLLLQSVDYVLGERMGDPDSLSDRQKKLVGSGGLSQAAPIGSVSGFMTGEIFTPPAVDAITQALIIPIMEGDAGKMEKAGASVLKNFAPGAGLFRLITDDLVTLVTGESPKGSFVDKTLEGAETIRRELEK